MFFRNLTLFRCSPGVTAGLEQLDEALAGHALKPLGPMELSRHGFVPPLGRGHEAFTHHVGDCTLLTIGHEDKLLPAAVVNQLLAEKLEAIAERDGRRPGVRERKRIKNELLDELLPRAFARPSRLDLYLDRKHGWLVLDTASRKAAENAIGALRDALGSFPVLPLAAQETPRARLTEWLAGGELPASLSLGDECELRDAAGSAGAVVRCRRQELASDEIREHLRNGKQVYQLGLEFEGRLSFVLGEDLVVRKLRFLDAVQDELDLSEVESAAAEMDARFALMTLELQRLLEKLALWFGLPRPQDDA